MRTRKIISGIAENPFWLSGTLEMKNPKSKKIFPENFFAFPRKIIFATEKKIRKNPFSKKQGATPSKKNRRENAQKNRNFPESKKNIFHFFRPISVFFRFFHFCPFWDFWMAWGTGKFFSLFALFLFFVFDRKNIFFKKMQKKSPPIFAKIRRSYFYCLYPSDFSKNKKTDFFVFFFEKSFDREADFYKKFSSLVTI